MSLSSRSPQSSEPHSLKFASAVLGLLPTMPPPLSRVPTLAFARSPSQRRFCFDFSRPASYSEPAAPSQAQGMAPTARPHGPSTSGTSWPTETRTHRYACMQHTHPRIRPSAGPRAHPPTVPSTRPAAPLTPCCAALCQSHTLLVNSVLDCC
jgi:hypothetical protein